MGILSKMIRCEFLDKCLACVKENRCSFIEKNGKGSCVTLSVKVKGRFDLQVDGPLTPQEAYQVCRAAFSSSNDQSDEQCYGCLDSSMMIWLGLVLGIIICCLVYWWSRKAPTPISEDRSDGDGCSAKEEHDVEDTDGLSLNEENRSEISDATSFKSAVSFGNENRWKFVYPGTDDEN